MIKLTEIIKFKTLYEVCLSGITGNRELSTRLINAKNKVDILDVEYRSKAIDGKLYELVPLKCSNVKRCERLKKINIIRVLKNKKFKRKTTKYNPIVFEDIRRLEFIKLYEQYFVSKDKSDARAIYDQILASAKQKCPYCCGIGNPRNLDHYLPKAHFPKYSILPVNLVPSCRDCNMDAKADNIIASYENQLLHPYLDKPHFFNEQWIHVEFKSSVLDENTSFFYVAKAPDNWDDIDKERVKNHFKSCDLGVRFSKDAVDSFIHINAQIHGLRTVGLDDNKIVKTLLAPILNNSQRSINHWEKVLVKGIIDTYF